LKALAFNPEKCIGCKLCHLACSGQNEDQFNPRLARLNVVYAYAPGELKIEGHTCNLDMACIKACPTGAIQEKNGRLRFDENLCTDCSLCVTACPNRVIVKKERGVGVCVQCFTCANWCPTGALTFEEVTN